MHFSFNLYGNCQIQTQGRYRYDVHENCLILKIPQSIVQVRPKFFHSLDPAHPILNETPPNLHPQQTMEQQPHRTCERTKSKQKQNQVTSHSNLPRVLLFDCAPKQCSGIVKGWFHCLTPDPIGRFLVIIYYSVFL